ncbi:MAG TPA: N-acetyltransferase [Caulobacteraceae bacterium]|jgi:putative acetyltransferase|nr:N-acetyltransferase [Caulobacteraceae bacterium]
MVRQPKPKDFPAIHAVVAAAFGREAEALIVEGVRAEGAALLELVAEEDGKIVGHVLFNRMTCEPQRRIAGLGPVAVTPDVQSRGYGEALCKAGIEALRQMGAEAVVVLGHPTYYPRFGFSHEMTANIASRFAERPAFMAMELVPGVLAVPVKVDYPRSFGA